MSPTPTPTPTPATLCVTNSNGDSIYVCPACYAAHYHGVRGWKALPLPVDAPPCEECGVALADSI
jgi:hypothetical protein